MRLFFLASLFLLTACGSSNNVSGDSEPGGIKNTGAFISYFEGLDNMKSYINLKTDIQQTALTIRNSDMSAGNKAIMKDYYNRVRSRSEEMYNQILNDLMSKDKRKEIKSNPAGYVQSLNYRFETIRESFNAFDLKHKEIVGTSKGWVTVLINLIKQFVLPVANAFINELINQQVRTLLDTKLKPVLVIRDWDSL